MNHSEVNYWITEFVSDIGQWPNLLSFLTEKGATPKEICDAINDTADEAGYCADLTEEDCS